MCTFSGTGKGLVCLEAGTSFQPSYFIGLTKVVFAGQYTPRAKDGNLVHWTAVKISSKRRNRLVPRKKLLFIIPQHGKILAGFLLLSPSHLIISCLFSSSSYTAKPEDQSRKELTRTAFSCLAWGSSL